MPISLSEITQYLENHSVTNYAALPSAASAINELWYCINSQGTAWLPGSLGGTYYSQGWYFSDGINWTHQESAFEASLTEVNTGIITDKFVSPKTFNDASKWATKEDVSNKTDSSTGASTDSIGYFSRKGTFSLINSWFGTLLFGNNMTLFAAKTTPIDNDIITISDSFDGDKAKKTKMSELWLNYFKKKVDNQILRNDFRLSLTSGVSVTNSDVVAATAIYCTPHSGNTISLYNGSSWDLLTSSEFSLSLGTLTNKMPYDVFCYSNAGVPTLEYLAWTDATNRATALTTQDGILVKSGATTRRYLGTFYNAGNQTSTVTISNASPCVITYTGHALDANAPIVFTTTGGLPSGIVAGTTYYVASLGTIGTNTFNISLTPGGALINTTTAGSGTHTATVPTYCEDSQLNRYLWNAYNQAQRKFYRFESTTSWNYTTATYRQSNGSAVNQFNFVNGLETPIFLIAQQRVGNSTAKTQLLPGIGLDVTNNVVVNYPIANPIADAAAPNLANVVYNDYVSQGKHYLSLIEYSAASGTTLWYAFTAKGNIFN